MVRRRSTVRFRKGAPRSAIYFRNYLWSDLSFSWTGSWRRSSALNAQDVPKPPESRLLDVVAARQERPAGRLRVTVGSAAQGRARTDADFGQAASVVQWRRRQERYPCPAGLCKGSRVQHGPGTARAISASGSGRALIVMIGPVFPATGS